MVEANASMDHYGWVFTLTIPYPDAETMDALHPHAGGNSHWKKSKGTKASRQHAKILSSPHAPAEPWNHSRLFLRFFKPNNRILDHQNMLQRMKGTVDGVVDAGVIKDDNDKHLEVFNIMSAVDKKNPRIELVFQRLRD